MWSRWSYDDSSSGCNLFDNLCPSLQPTIRAVCAIIDAFHFPLTDEPNQAALPTLDEAGEPAATLEDTEGHMAETMGGETLAQGVPARRPDNPADIQQTLLKLVLPSLQSQLVGIPPSSAVEKLRFASVCLSVLCCHVSICWCLFVIYTQARTHTNTHAHKHTCTHMQANLLFLKCQ